MDRSYQRYRGTGRLRHLTVATDGSGADWEPAAPAAPKFFLIRSINNDMNDRLAMIYENRVYGGDSGAGSGSMPSSKMDHYAGNYQDNDARRAFFPDVFFDLEKNGDRLLGTSIPDIIEMILIVGQGPEGDKIAGKIMGSIREYGDKDLIAHISRALELAEEIELDRKSVDMNSLSDVSRNE